MSARITFANVIRSITCKACNRTWGIGCNVHKAGSTTCPGCGARVPLGKGKGKR
jgi:RNase P subunit RPR2